MNAQVTARLGETMAGCAALLAGIACGASPGDHRVTIAPGVRMPIVNFGGYDGGPVTNFSDALRTGARGFDTALTYGDDVQSAVRRCRSHSSLRVPAVATSCMQLGGAVRAAVSSGIPRSDIFVTTKIPCCPNNLGNWTAGMCVDYKSNADSIDETIRLIGMSVDLLLLHWPCATAEETAAAWSAMEDALAAGKTRAIGVSNANSSILEALRTTAKVPPAVNQCDNSVGLHRREPSWSNLGADEATVKYCQSHGISYSAWSPLGGSVGIPVLSNPTVVSVARAHNKSAAQVAFRWLIQQNMTLVTSGDKHAYVVEDLDVFSFELTAPEMAALNAA